MDDNNEGDEIKIRPVSAGIFSYLNSKSRRIKTIQQQEQMNNNTQATFNYNNIDHQSGSINPLQFSM